MKLSKTFPVIGLGIALMFPAVATTHPMPPHQTVLRVSLYDEVGIDSSTLQEAEREASRVFRQSNIEVLWLHCPQVVAEQNFLVHCSEATFPTHLHLRILQRSHAQKASVMGISFLSEGDDGCYADVFYGPMLKLQMETSTRVALILGHVMAHELGHLLLGTNSHSRDGLMVARWNRDDLARAARGDLLFGPEESRRMKSQFKRDDMTVEMTRME